MPIVFSFSPDFEEWGSELYCRQNKKDGKIFKIRNSDYHCDTAWGIWLSEAEFDRVMNLEIEEECFSDVIHAFKERRIVIRWRKSGKVKIEDL